MKLAADNMLGSLARWLRLFGHDVAYPGDAEDEELITIAKEEGRILITRDRDLARRADVETLLLESLELDDQLLAVLSLIPPPPGKRFTRCSVCNTLLVPTDSGECEGKVPDRVLESGCDLWKCNGCGRFYWPGSHHEKIEKRMEELEGRLSQRHPLSRVSESR